MNVFHVNLYDGGIWDGQDDQRVEACNHAEALAAVIDEELCEAGPVRRLRATVSKVAYRDVARKFFYRS